MASIHVILKSPGSDPHTLLILNSLELIQELVGGYVEQVKIARDCVILCDEDGKLKNKPFCARIGGYDFVGDIIIAGLNRKGWTDVPMTCEELKGAFPSLWEGGKE